MEDLRLAGMTRYYFCIMYEIRDFDQKEWPERLKEIPQPPKRLRIAGMLPPDNLYYLCVVGSRTYTPYGERAVHEIVGGLAGYPLAIVSGLAIGIDALAHRAALDAKLPTIGLPGSGLSPNALYPRSNADLAREIVEKNGALISEYDDNYKAMLYSFPQRNRLMAGLSHATLIIEAGAKSGTLITARLSTEYNRDVLVVPGSIFSPQSRGTNWLFRQGATPITSARDILMHWGLVSKDNKLQDAPSTSAEPDAHHTTLFETAALECTPTERAILEQLAEPQERDVLIRTTGISVDEANIAFATLEIKGLIDESLGKIKIKEQQEKDCTAA